MRLSLVEIHTRLADTASLFVLALAVWAIILRVRNRPLEGNWIGAAVVGELLILAQSGLGAWLYLQGLGGALPRPFLHILYGIVAIVTLPGAYSYFSNIEEENVKTVAMATACLFLWGVLSRAVMVAEYLVPVL